MTSPIFRFGATLLFALAVIFVIDQYIKMLSVDGFRYYTECIDLILVYNKGVAFSMFAFLDEWHKYIQLVMIFGVMGYAFYLKKACYAMPIGILLGAAFSNVYVPETTNSPENSTFVT